MIELLIVVAIIGIMTVIAALSLGNGRIEKETETNAREFVAVVREAQNYALTGKQFIASTNPCGFVVSWSGTNYMMTYRYRDASDNCNQTQLMITYPLKNGVSFNAGGSVDFSLPHATFSGGDKNAQFTKQSINHVACIYADSRISNSAGTTCP